MSESDFSKEIRRLINSNGGHASQVESHATSAGIPDIDYCIDGEEGKVEIKFGTDTKCPHLRPTQISWVRNRLNAGGTVRLIAKFITSDGTFYCTYVDDDIIKLSGVSKTCEWIKMARHLWAGDLDIKVLKILLTLP